MIVVIIASNVQLAASLGNVLLPVPSIYSPVVLKLLLGVTYGDVPPWEQLQSYLTPIKDYFDKIGLPITAAIAFNHHAENRASLSLLGHEGIAQMHR